MSEKDYLNRFSSIDDAVKLSDDKLEQIEGGQCDQTCKKCQTAKNGAQSKETTVAAQTTVQ